VSVGWLHQYFPNKNAIVLALIGSLEKAFHDSVVKAVQGGKEKVLNRRYKPFRLVDKEPNRRRRPS
jgi:hypothetical protein